MRLLIALTIILIVWLLANRQVKTPNVSIRELLNFSFQTTRGDFISQMEAHGGKVHVEHLGSDSRDVSLAGMPMHSAGEFFSVQVTQIAVEGIPIHSLTAFFTVGKEYGRLFDVDENTPFIPIEKIHRYPVSSETLKYISFFAAPDSSATYLNPGKRYDKLKMGLEASLGKPSSAVRDEDKFDLLWQGSLCDATLRYNHAEGKFIWLDLNYPDQRSLAPLPPPTPDVFAWPIGQYERQREIRLGMTREQVKALEEGVVRTDAPDVLEYEEGIMLGDWMGPISFRFDEAGKLTKLSMHFTKPFEMSVTDFWTVQNWLCDNYFGAPEQDDPMIWAEGNTCNPLDGSTFIQAIQEGMLSYRSDWVIGGVQVTHTVAAEDGEIVHAIVCVPEP